MVANSGLWYEKRGDMIVRKASENKTGYGGCD